MTLEEESRYLEIGRQLFSCLQQYRGNLPSKATLQCIVADIAASDADVVLPLKTMVAMPMFSLLVRKADIGGSALHSQTLLQELEPIFSSQILEKLSEVLSGLLESARASRASSGRERAADEPSDLEGRKIVLEGEAINWLAMLLNDAEARLESDVEDAKRRGAEYELQELRDYRDALDGLGRLFS